MRDELVQWLRDGGHESAVKLLLQCEIKLQFIDLLVEFFGERQYEYHDAEILAPQSVLQHLETTFEAEAKQIEEDLRELAKTHHWHIRDVAWLPAPPVIKSPTELDLDAQLAEIDAAHVQRLWEKAISRRDRDPDGAITAAKSLLESVCKYILDQEGIAYSSGDDLPKLYHRTADTLQITPDKQDQGLMRRAMGNAQAVVSAVAAIRNFQGDAHGPSATQPVASADLAALVVNLAGAVSSFLVNVWQRQRNRDAA